MSLEDIQNKAIKTYNNNLSYLQENHKELYEKIELFNQGIDQKIINPTYDLEYKDNYFDAINLESKQFYYGTNSIKISKKFVEEQVSSETKKNSFKAFYYERYSNEFAKNALKSNVIPDFTYGNAPFVNFAQNYSPVIQEYKKIYKYLIFGVGLGIHIPLIHEKINASFYLIVEPNLEIFRLSLFVVDYSLIAKNSNLTFSVAQNEMEFRELFRKHLSNVYIFNHYIKLFKLSDNVDLYINTVQNVLISQDHLTYSYDRAFKSMYRTNTYIQQDYKILNLSKCYSTIFPEKPILLLAAGPSLQKEIEFVKQNQDKFIIIAIYATMPLLEKHHIKPDIITQYDEQNRQVLNTVEKVKDISFFDNTIFIFASHVNKKLPQYFKKENIFMFQGLYQLKKGFGRLTSPSIGELTYALALILAKNNDVYLLGLDLAMTEDKKTHIDGHTGSNAFKDLKDENESRIQEYSLRKNTIKVKGNFQDIVFTTPVFKLSIDVFNMHTQKHKQKDTKVYNLSDGAYFHDTPALNTKDINIEKLEKLDKNNLSQTLYNYFEINCEINYNQNDKELRELIKKDIKRLEKTLNRFYKKKNYKNLDEYKRTLFNLCDDLLLTVKDDGLKTLLQNFASATLHHIFYVLNLKRTIYFKEYQDELNNILYTQFNKIIETYKVSIKLY